METSGTEDGVQQSYGLVERFMELDPGIFLTNLSGLCYAVVAHDFGFGLEATRRVSEFVAWDMFSWRLWLSDKIRPSFDVDCEEI